MKTNKIQIKKLIKEIISVAIKEIDTAENSSWIVDDDIVAIEGLQLSDGRSIDIDIWFKGNWDDGAFDYEYGSIKGTHRYPVQFSIDDYNIYEIRNGDTHEVIWQLIKGGKSLQEFDVKMWQEIEKYWDGITSEVEREVEPPEPDFDDRDDDR